MGVFQPDHDLAVVSWFLFICFYSAQRVNYVGKKLLGKQLD